MGIVDRLLGRRREPPPPFLAATGATRTILPHGARYLVRREEVPKGPSISLLCEGDAFLHVWSPEAMPRELVVLGDLRLIVPGPTSAIATPISVSGNLDLVDAGIGIPPGCSVDGFASVLGVRVDPEADRPRVGRGILVHGIIEGKVGDGFLDDPLPRPEVLRELGLRPRGPCRLLIRAEWVDRYLDLVRRTPVQAGDRRSRLPPGVVQVAPDPSWFDPRFGAGPR